MSFIATANPPKSTDETTIENDGFWPDIDRAQLRAVCRLDGTVTAERLHHALVAAVVAVNAELQDWQDAQIAMGVVTLADVPGRQIGGASAKVSQYLRAIYSHVQAQLAEAYRDIDTMPQGNGKEARVQSALEVRVDSHLQQLRWAIADVQDIRRTIAALL